MVQAKGLHRGQWRRAAYVDDAREKRDAQFKHHEFHDPIFDAAHQLAHLLPTRKLIGSAAAERTGARTV